MRSGGSRYTEIALVGDPVLWQGTSKDVNAALNRVLGLGFAFFIGVKQQVERKS
jgi:hypothetical protein